MKPNFIASILVSTTLLAASTLAVVALPGTIPASDVQQGLYQTWR